MQQHFLVRLFRQAGGHLRQWRTKVATMAYVVEVVIHVSRELKSPRAAHVVGYPAAENNRTCALSLATFGNLYDASCVVMQC